MKKLSISVVIVCIAVFIYLGIERDDSAHEHGVNVVDTASSAGKFETLLAAATAAGLLPALTGDEPIILFAPTDDAFGALPAGTIDKLLNEENREQLVRILSYHVVSGVIKSEALADKAMLNTLAGPNLTFVASENGYVVEGARITSTDLLASNGVIHTIDRVMLPPEQLSREEAHNMIVAAINKGAPMYNHGNHKGTVKVYTMAVEALLDRADLYATERTRLKTGLEESGAVNSSQEKAWGLRYALDDVLKSIRMTNNRPTFAL